MATCAPFEGNSDFYGLGIRVGVYLQWISSWISLLLDPESAQATFDSNSVFVFAIAIATVIAARQGAAAIEMYLMLQFMLGFFVTTLSTLGVRLWFMSPDRLVILESKATEAWATGLKAIEGLKARFREERTRRQQRPKRTWREWIRPSGSRDTQTYTRAADSLLPQVPGFGCFGPAGDGLYMAFNVLHFLWSLPTFMPLRTLSSLKPPGLSWSGVVWRTTIAAMVAAYNLTFWFDSPGKGAKQPPRPGCGHPYVFLFSKQRMEGPVVILGHVAAIIIAIFVFPATLILLLLTARLTVYACMFLYRDMLYMLSPNTPQTIRSALDRVNALLEKQGVPFIGELASPLLLMNVGFASMVDVLGFLATPKGEAIRFSDVIRLCVSLGTGKVAVREGNGTQPAHGGQMSGWKGARYVRRLFSHCWRMHVLIVAGDPI